MSYVVNFARYHAPGQHEYETLQEAKDFIFYSYEHGEMYPESLVTPAKTYSSEVLVEYCNKRSWKEDNNE